MQAVLVRTDLRADEQEWGQLIAQTAQGDQAALAALYDRTSSRVYGVALKILGDREAAEEVTLDVYTQVWRQAHKYDESRGTPGGWLMTLARTRSIDRYRAGYAERGKLQPLETAALFASEEMDPEQQAAAQERQQVVREALKALSPEQREAISLACFWGLSHSEIADKLKLPLGTVKTRIRQGMIKLRELLSQHEEGLVS
ncbi:MAG: sigma-70 family RNA polymerase sigma factor [Candidatus Methylomirabilaceae bacterium]